MVASFSVAFSSQCVCLLLLFTCIVFLLSSFTKFRFIDVVIVVSLSFPVQCVSLDEFPFSNCSSDSFYVPSYLRYIIFVPLFFVVEEVEQDV